jgi:2-polyprenyl-3-methyl-5-hydroxy-6-metoxy-1,4-benzoquinol methylase
MSSEVVENYGWEASEGAPESCNYIAPKVVEIIKTLKVARVADLGSGNGSLCAELAATGLDVVGIEYDAAGCAVSKKNHPGIPFYNFGVQDDPATLLASEAKFDCVISTEVVEHLFAPHLLPAYAAAVLRDRGTLVISTPYHGYIKNLALSVFDAWDKHHTPLWHGGHIKFWSRKTLTTLLEQNGFKVTGFHGVGRLPLMWKSMILVAQKQ